ncbi:hypothetical protein [Stutzerimonas nitrititolerans]|uniref:hypothetical protein n=1 Tax=Stutzerimonas nitrititolerans TaxID=2482751 RepID=UPI002896CB7D|nr:hypothetical protein [Stutzerimonas nitrititolerans]
MENTENQAPATTGEETATAAAATVTITTPSAPNDGAPEAGQGAAKAAAKPSGKASGKSSGKAKSAATESTADAAPEKAVPNPREVEIWPLRSYQDAGEIKRRGSKSYTVPKRHADALIARGLASAEKPASIKPESNK